MNINTLFQLISDENVDKADKLLFMPDLFGYLLTGKPVCEMNYCGNEIGSYWSRGTAWMIYGLTKVLQYSGDRERYLSPLEGVSAKYLAYTSDYAVPLWDFRLPEGEKILYDSSAAAIAGSAFMEFDALGVKPEIAAQAIQTTDRAIALLRGETYFGSDDVEYILKYQNEEGALWGDYFFTELIMKKLYGNRLVDFWI